MINDEKTKKLFRVGGIVLGLVLLYSFFTLFMGQGPQVKKSVSPKMGAGMGAFDAPMANTEAVELEMGAGGAVMPERKMMRDEAAVDTFSGVDASESLQIIDKKVIKNGDLSLKVESADRAADEISSVVKQKGGEVFSTNFYEAVKGQKSGFVTVRVPVDKFDETMIDIKKIATQVLSESTTGQDVTEQYSDLQAQLKNKKVEEESFVKILGTAGKIDDVLAATREVARVRGEIERLEGRIKFMDSQTDMSNITINLTEDVNVVPVSEGWRPWQVVKQSLRELMVNIQGFADGVIRFIIVGIPSLIPFALLVGFLYWVGKKIFNKISA